MPSISFILLSASLISSLARAKIAFFFSIDQKGYVSFLLRRMIEQLTEIVIVVEVFNCVIKLLSSILEGLFDFLEILSRHYFFIIKF